MISRTVFIRPLIALFVVTSVVAAGPLTGSASAEITASTNCGTDDIIRGTYSVVDPEIDCGLYDNSQELQTQTDAYANAQAIESHRSQTATDQNNLGQDVEGLAWMEGKSAYIY